jgi:hypothetical protein
MSEIFVCRPRANDPWMYTTGALAGPSGRKLYDTSSGLFEHRPQAGNHPVETANSACQVIDEGHPE